MSIHASGSNFISNAAILVWMQEKTDGIYGHMREAMDTSNTRAGAEDALNTIKGKLGDLKAKNATPEEVQDLINQAMHDFPDVPEVAKVLGPYSDDLSAQVRAATIGVQGARWQLQALEAEASRSGSAIPSYTAARIAALREEATPKPLSIGSDKADSWAKNIGTTVEGLGKQDQLGLINIQEFNAQLNQAKQTASALMDAADKAANSIINTIA